MKHSAPLIHILGLLTLTLICSASHAWSECKFERKIDRVVDINSAPQIQIEAGAGTLEVSGAKRDDVRIKAVLCSSSEDALAEMDIMTELQKGKAHFETFFPRRSGWRDNENMSIDLVMTVPTSARLVVKDSSGEAEVSGVAGLDMTDSSGRLEIDDISGDLKVVDSSGELKIQNVSGSVTLTDSSGGIYVKNVGGSVIVEADSSGGIEARQIKQDVLIKIDSSGKIDVRDVGGNFTVEKDTSGGIHFDQVAGKVSI